MCCIISAIDYVLRNVFLLPHDHGEILKFVVDQIQIVITLWVENCVKCENWYGIRSNENYVKFVKMFFGGVDKKTHLGGV